jgi:CBASS immunity sensor of nucleotide second messenger signals/HNH endonuclease
VAKKKAKARTMASEKRGGARRRRETTSTSTVTKPSRKIRPHITVLLYTRAGGRCEFDGCNDYLLEHPTTTIVGNFAEQAHIWAFNEGGPRGRGDGRPVDINNVENLMLLCGPCHKLIDRVEPQNYTVETLRKFKEEHESRVFELTGLAKDRDTVPLVMRAQVAGKMMDISDAEMQAAVAPNNLRRRDKIPVDISAIPDQPHAAYWKTGCSAIDAGIDKLNRIEPRRGRTLRTSVFAIAPIPLLIYLGSKLSDKQVVDLYQRHRSPDTWNWYEGSGDSRFVTRQHQSDGNAVALLINVSGTNPVSDVINLIGTATVYELTLEGKATATSVLQTRADLDRFSAEYGQVLARVRAAHPGLAKLHVFPAVPAPVAVAIGRQRLPKVDAALEIYDRDKRVGGFAHALSVR